MESGGDEGCDIVPVFFLLDECEADGDKAGDSSIEQVTDAGWRGYFMPSAASGNVCPVDDGA